MASLSEIDQEAALAVAAIKAGNYDTALLHITCAQMLIATTADMEMDRQRKEYRNREAHFDSLYKRVIALKQKAGRGGRLKSIGVRRRCP